METLSIQIYDPYNTKDRPNDWNNIPDIFYLLPPQLGFLQITLSN